ncbi:aminodeoxychorismate synthase component I [Chromohalobacter canadensis]|uniref:aminodeoxychorismate synthase component I n=1 Tax=Chromohalobacter canadensis TaxID=141389 RepID=UPI0021BDF946|nr:aminodeoxychorismate synthase component I [Chromohalobacter canadensis]MCT8469996.1 aminodeoxychorismate synthase component I [Chromohalobacter canadensis]MCT8471918.1 aminodeoxychorismate synthase component I [Chromohalobacter canadensis]MCT8499371.1 aminodeoxychorismate synthase component I [Chromohalobacter canadensis]
MPTLELTPLPYHGDPLERFERLRRRSGAVLLDSGFPTAPGGRYDILASDPIAWLEVNRDGQVTSDVADLPGDPLAAQRALLERLPTPDVTSELPFLGGLIGYWSYDFGRHLEAVSGHACEAVTLPHSRVGLYDWAIIHDHHAHQAWLVATPARRAQVLTWLQATPSPTSTFQLRSPFRGELDRATYGERFRTVQHYIRSGDCYQINLAQRFSAHYQGDLWHAYRRLRQATPTPYGAYLAWDDKGILSLSPERFLEVVEGRVETRPIKGTRPRGDTSTQDQHYARELRDSLKDTAENVMIVDLLRNDLGRVCQPGSVRVPQLCGLESYANVHHLVSVVTGELDETRHALDLLGAAFPGGSITGAPKVRAMQLIDNLEPSRRSVYCGSIGYVDTRGRMDTSIAIRTAVADAGQLHLWGGGGLVADSDEEAEYQETLAKISRLMEALGAAGAHERDESRILSE